MKTRFVDTSRGSLLKAEEEGNVLIEVWAHKKLVHVSLVNRDIRNSKGIEKFVGVSQCPKDKVFNVELETQIAKARAEAKEQFALVDILREQRTDEY